MQNFKHLTFGLIVGIVVGVVIMSGVTLLGLVEFSSPCPNPTGEPLPPAPYTWNTQGKLTRLCDAILVTPGDIWDVVRQEDGHTVEIFFEVFNPGSDRPDAFQNNVVVHTFNQKDPGDSKPEEASGFDPDFEINNRDIDGVVLQLFSVTGQVYIRYDGNTWIPNQVSAMEQCTEEDVDDCGNNG